MLRLVISLAVCMTLVHCATTGDSDQNNLHKEGKDVGDVSEGEEAGDETTKCIICNSSTDDFCDDETFDMENEGSLHNFSTNCFDYHNDPKTSPETRVKPPAGAKFFCTKTKITFEFDNTYEKARIVRQCSYAPGRYGWADCYYTATPKYSTTVCKCVNEVAADGEMIQQNCNSATSIASSLFLFVTALLMLR